MDNKNENSILKIAIISLCISFGLSYISKTINNKPEKTEEKNETVILQSETFEDKQQNQLIINLLREIAEDKNNTKPLDDERELSIIWLESPVTQLWVEDKENGVWRSEDKNRYRSPPSIKLGLREDGIVIWKQK